MDSAVTGSQTPSDMGGLLTILAGLQMIFNRTDAKVKLSEKLGLSPAQVTLDSIKTAQVYLEKINGLDKPFNGNTAKDNKEYDYVIIGGGTSGCILANRLSEDENIEVLVIEAGSDPPLETHVAGFFGLSPESNYDYNFQTENDQYTSRNIRKQSVQITAGKMLGGSSGLSHLLHVRGDPYDYNRLAEVTGDESWNYDSMLPYLIKSEKIIDKEILNSSYATFHGTNGNVGVTREPSDKNKDIIKSFEEIGFKYNLDINSKQSLGVTEPFLYIFDNMRSSMSESYLQPIKNRKNLFIWKQTTATKILFNSNKRAIAVEALNSKKKKIIVKAKREVILSAGVIKSPQLLMLSGIGPESHLQQFDIPVISNLPVGQNLQDHVSAIIIHKLKRNVTPYIPPAPTQFPAPATIGNKALDPENAFGDYQAINLLLPHDDSAALLQVCTSTFKYINTICDKFYEANIGRDILFSLVFKQRPLSTGYVQLKSKDPLEDPKIHVGHYSNPNDLEDTASYFLDFSNLVHTEYFKSVGAELLHVDLPECDDKPKDSKEYWQCYAIEMSTSLFHFVGTCQLGTVLNSKLQVKGGEGLRVVDASSMPYVTGGDNMAALIAFAEKAVDLIKLDL